MLAGLLTLALLGAPTEPAAAAGLRTPEQDARARASVGLPPAPNVAVRPPPRLRRCLSGVEPCYHATSARLLLAVFGLLTTGASLAVIFVGGDRQGLGDPGAALAAAGTVAMGAATIGGTASWIRLDGPAIDDRITPATIAVGVGMGGSAVTDEQAPWSMSASVAPTWTFPRDLGRLRLLGRVGGRLGAQTQRDPRPQATNDDGSFGLASRSKLWTADLGLDLAVRLPYPVNARARRHPFLGRFELRYKPLVSIARESVELFGEPRVSERAALMPLNLGFRWILSPRQRFTFYVGPRWDIGSYGEPGALARDQPSRAPLYSEAWFDIDLPMQRPGGPGRAQVVGQFTVGYVHSRFYGMGMNIGAVTGFLGHAVSQFALRVRPSGSPVAYQLELGARVGNGVNPYIRAGVVLPSLGGGGT